MWNSIDFGGKRWHIWRDVCDQFTDVSLRRECIPQNGAGAWHHSGRLASIFEEDVCLSRTKRLRPSARSAAKFCEGSAAMPALCPFSGDRTILGYAVGLVVIAAPHGAGLNPEKEAGGPPKRRTATDGPPHRASTHRPAPANWDFAAASCLKPHHTMREQSCLQFLFKRVGPCHIPLPPLSDMVSLSVWPALADALCHDARRGFDLFG